MNKNTLPLLGIQFCTKSKKKLFQEIAQLIQYPKKFSYIVTPNPEIILKSITDEDYWRAINSADIITADGIGIQYGLLFWYFQRIPRITGVKITETILQTINGSQKKVLIINRANGLSSKQELQNYFSSHYPSLKTHVICIKNINSLEKEIQQIKSLQPEIIFCMLGAPYQEKILYALSHENSFPCLAISNGATLDFKLNKQKRAPKILQNLGLEWLWRLIILKRFKRIFHAVIQFPITVVWWRIRSLLMYRHSCMAAILHPNKDKILIAHFKEYHEWGIPKGGADSKETILQATLREMHEELGIKEHLLEKLAQKKFLYKYTWHWQRRAQRGYKGQKIAITLFNFLGDPQNDIVPDNIETDNFKWVSVKDLNKHVSPTHKESIHLVQKFVQNNCQNE